METQLIKILTKLGLTEKESKVFLACTEQGTSVVSTIAQSAGINRVTTYDILEKLKQKGLVSYYSKKKIKYFSSIDPEILLEEFETRTNELRSALPKLKALSGEISHPRVRYFEGLEGIKNIYADTLTSKSEILNYANSSEIRKIWPTYDQDYVKKRADKKIYLRGLSPSDLASQTVKKESEKFYREIRLIPQDQFNFTNEINIYDDKVAIISLKEELIGMIIESHEIANSQRAIFNMCWQFATILNNSPSKGDNSSIKEKLLKPLKETDLIAELSKKEDSSNLSLF